MNQLRKIFPELIGFKLEATNYNHNRFDELRHRYRTAFLKAVLPLVDKGNGTIDAGYHVKVRVETFREWSHQRARWSDLDYDTTLDLYLHGFIVELTEKNTPKGVHTVAIWTPCFLENPEPSIYLPEIIRILAGKWEYGEQKITDAHAFDNEIGNYIQRYRLYEEELQQCKKNVEPLENLDRSHLTLLKDKYSISKDLYGTDSGKSFIYDLNCRLVRAVNADERANKLS